MMEVEESNGSCETIQAGGSDTGQGVGGRRTVTSVNPTDKTPVWKLQLLMEKLRTRSKASNLGDTARNLRASIIDRRLVIDQDDKTELQRSLDVLQQSIKVNSLQSMIERLEMVSRQQGLRFTTGSSGNEWFISSDMFYLELVIDPQGVVQEVKIQHDGKAEQQSCPEIVDSLRRHDFVDYAAHLEGLVSIYQLNADKKTKSKVFIALQALETDLASMASTYAHVTDGETVVMKSLIGLLQPRRGGHPIKLVFYITPYEFLDLSTKGTLQADVQTIQERKLGVAATVSVQAYSSYKLQMNTTVSIVRAPDGKSMPRYGTLNATNSTALPACFTVNLAKAIPMCKELLQSIQTTTGIHCFDFTDPQPILNLVTKHVSNGSLNCGNNKGLYVALPDQTHCYFMTETQQLEGIMVSTISFTLASQLPQVIATLRQQLTFNTLVGSCVRVGNKADSTCIVFEVSALSHQKLTVSFQHPLEDSLVTLEFDLRDVSHPQCRLHAIANAADIIPTLEEYACKVVHRTMSIPVTLRAVIRRWKTMKVKYEPPNQDHIRIGSSSYGSDSSLHPTPDVSCGTESERAQNQKQPQPPTQQLPGIVMNLNMSKARVPQNSSFTISPINTPNPFPSTQPQQPMDMMSTFMNNPMFSSLSNFQNLSGLNMQNFTPNMALQMMAASQMQGKNSSVLMGLLDQVGQRGKRKKRKGTSEDNPSGTSNGSNSSIPRPSPSPSPKSVPPSKSPIRRQSSEMSESGAPTPPTPQTPSTTAINLLMTELGLEHPDPRWNIDITPVTTPTEKFAPSKMNFGSVQDYESVTGTELDIEAGKFPVPANKKLVVRDGVKRSMSLDSSAMAGHHSSHAFDPLDNNYKMTPSLSITPVTGTTSTVNSLLAAMRPGIEIIPLPNPVAIPNSITVTPIMPKQSPNPPEKVEKKVDEAEIKRKLLEKKERKRKLEIEAKNSATMKPKSMQVKKPRPAFPNPTIAKAMSSLGKPSVTTLKSVSVSMPGLMKYPEMGMNKPKLHKPGPASQTKIIKTFSSPGGQTIKTETTTVQIKTEPNTSPVSKPEPKVEMKPKPSVSLFSGGGAGKKGGLLAVIDKLKSQQHSTAEPEPKKELSKLDFLKVSSAITSELAKKNAGMPGLMNPEYMIKQSQGQGGLKLTINKTKAPSKEKKGMGMVPIKRGISPSGIKSPKTMTKKIVPPLTSLSHKNPKSSPNPNEEMDLTKKLFMPGAVRSLESGVFDGPKFDTKFQIPKKSRSVVAPDPPKDKPDEVPTPPKEIKEDSEDSVNEPPTLSIAATALIDESDKDEPPVLSAQVAIQPQTDEVVVLPTPAPVALPMVPVVVPDFISPESPDLVSVEEAVTPTIPTTPLNVVSLVPSPIPQIQSPDKSPDPDALIMEVDVEPEPADMSVDEPKEPEPMEDEGQAAIMPPPPAPPAETVPVPSPLSAALPIVSVHIVHSPSPQPGSPALLRSPMVVVQSPHSAHASPYTIIDDDLMDEALIG